VTDVAEFIETVERITAGASVVDPSLVQELVQARQRRDPLDVLSPREREALALMAKCASNAGIARRIFVSEGTVEKHVRSILDLPESGTDHRPGAGAPPVPRSPLTHPGSAGPRSRTCGTIIIPNGCASWHTTRQVSAHWPRQPGHRQWGNENVCCILFVKVEPGWPELRARSNRAAPKRFRQAERGSLFAGLST
jgi:DNA-binding CsgD family transcriptional regulator